MKAMTVFSGNVLMHMPSYFAWNFSRLADHLLRSFTLSIFYKPLKRHKQKALEFQRRRDHNISKWRKVLCHQHLSDLKRHRFLSQVELGVPSKQREQCKQRYRCQKLQGHFREHKSCTVLLKRRESMRVTGNGLDQVVSCSVTWRVVWTSELEPNWGDSAHHHYFYPGLPICSLTCTSGASFCSALECFYSHFSTLQPECSF